MSEMSSWRDVKDRARRIDPDNGSQLAEIRRSVGMTQAQLAEATGLTQARISQIENGDGAGLDTLRTYITGLGGHVDVMARVGTVRLDIA